MRITRATSALIGRECLLEEIETGIANAHTELTARGF
jgi:hypothetical protein